MDRTPDLLFEYLRDILYNPNAASLDLDKLDPAYRRVGEGLLYVGKSLNEQQALSKALVKGNLDVPLPPADNVLAAPLKTLHAKLKHLAWTSQQVAKGDYKQRVEFFGEFAIAFNTMTEQLEYRQDALKNEVESGENKAKALEQSYSLLYAVTNELQQWILVLNTDGNEVLFRNSTATEGMEKTPDLSDQLLSRLKPLRKLEEPAQWELEITTQGKVRYFSIAAYPLQWHTHDAVAYVISDVSDEREHVQKLESFAFRDTLTGISNRYAGMQALREWLGRQDFSLCFVDLDNLKYVNDNFGHAKGDEYIIDAARVLQTVDDTALVSRLGGDEFMLLVPDTQGTALEARMEVVRREMMVAAREAKKPYHGSLSYGVVEVPASSPISSSELLAEADERMYEYKRRHKKVRA